MVIKVTSKADGSSQSTVSNSILLNDASVVEVQLSPGDVASLDRVGNDLLIRLESGETILIQNFFAAGQDNDLVLRADDGTLYWAEGLDGSSGVALTEIGSVDQLIGGAGGLGGIPAGALLGALGAAAIGGVAIAAGSSGSSGGGAQPPISPPDPVLPVPPVMPSTPANLAVSPDGTLLTGSGQPGTSVVVVSADGINIGVGIVNPDGTFAVVLQPPQVDGEVLTVVASDNQGQMSSPALVLAPDITAPPAPDNLSVSADGSILTGTGEPGSTVQVTNAAGVILGTAPVSAAGTFQISLVPAQIDGEILTATQTDASGNTSSPGFASAPDLTPPETATPDAPTDITVAANGLSLSGNGEAGAAVNVTGPDGLVASGEVNEDGTFVIPLPTPLLNGEVVTVTQTNASGNTSEPGFGIAPDVTPPAIPGDLLVTPDGLSLTGTGEAGASVSVTGPDGLDLTGTVDEDGTFTIALPTPLLNGEEITVTQTDAAGLVSPPGVVSAPDVTPPAIPGDLLITPDGLSLTGTGEAGASVSVTGPDGLDLTGTVDEDGTFTIALPTPLLNGEELTVTQTDAAGLVSPPGAVSAPDVTPPAIPGDLLVAPDGLSLTGTGEAGASVSVTGPDGLDLTGTVDEDGTFTIALPTPLLNGEELTVTQTDAAGLVSPPGAVSAPDVMPPAIPGDLLVAPDGLSLTGTGEAGASVSVTGPDGLDLTGTVEEDGTFTIALPTPLLNGEELTVTQTDAAGLVSPPGAVSAPDVTPPAIPGDLLITPDGLSLTGTGEAGASVSVTGPDGLDLTGTVDEDGTFTIALPTPLLNGEELTVTQTDAVGLVSPPGAVSAPDVTLPIAPFGLQVDEDGEFLSGFGEPDTRVVATNSAGDVVGEGVILADGSFTIELATPQVEGLPLSVISIDAADNESLPGTASTPDLTAPAPVTNLVVSEDGAFVSGSGEIGATVVVYGPNSQFLGDGVVDLDGSFTIELSVPQLNNELLTLTQQDEGGNISPSATVNAPDDTPPLPADLLVVSADGLVVTGRGEPLAAVTVLGIGGVLLGTGSVLADGTFSVTLDPAQIDSQSLDVFLTDLAANTSPASSVIAPDVTPPAPPADLEVVEGGAFLTGTGEPNASVLVRGAGGATVGTGFVNTDGTFTVSLVPPQDNGQILRVFQTDLAGNGSPAATVTAPDLNPADDLVAAYDDIVAATIVLTPVTTTREGSQVDTVILNLGNFSQAFEFDVAVGTESDASFLIEISSLAGVLSNAFGILEVFIDGQWQTVGGTGTGGLLDLLYLGGNSVRIDATDLPASSYRLVYGGGGLLGALTEVSLSADFTDASLTEFIASAGPPAAGNLLDGSDGFPDSLGPDGLAVLHIDTGDGSFQAVTTTTIVEGAYGILTLQPDGSFTYAPNPSAASIGLVDSFSYSLIHPNGQTSQATLYVRVENPETTTVWSDLDPAQPATIVTATDNAGIALVESVPLEAPPETRVGVINYTTLLLGGSQNYLFSIDDGIQSDLTISIGTASVAGLLQNIRFSLEQFIDGRWVQIGASGNGNLIDIVGLVGGRVQAEINDLGAGSYRLRVANSGIGLVENVRGDITFVDTDLDVFTAGRTTTATGNVLSDDTTGSPLTFISVSADGTNYQLAAPGGTLLSGDYGDLLIRADGSYVYTPDASLDNVGMVDVFSYRLTGPNGETADALLTITIQQGVPEVVPVSTVQAADTPDDVVLLAALETHAASDGEELSADSFDAELLQNTAESEQQATTLDDVLISGDDAGLIEMGDEPIPITLPDSSTIAADSIFDMASLPVEDELQRSINAQSGL
ncbi:BapA prefix-like domain-containing protein [Aureimonas fodinaquatilis]|uniref:BapA prefix-like domain-containing protein n=1 Tax=Aureimonas fodinaquatilis TaxID=2565783 RepID=A0A5B0DYG7_9HYPH|nr:BapA/Bap/LapF family large adhesin [Aureimonas fodinaquatilis]KAA0970600.1 BapA prefix-like domain-containing protein [Aureimonas fodinaquatilis]